MNQYLNGTGGSASMNEPMVRGILGKSGFFMMGFMPALIVALVLVLTKSGEASKITYRNSSAAGRQALLVAVGSTSLGGSGGTPSSGDAGLPPGMLPGGIKGMPAPVLPPLPKGVKGDALTTAQTLASRGPDTLFILFVRSPAGN